MPHDLWRTLSEGFGAREDLRSIRRDNSEAGHDSVWLLKLFVVLAIGVLGAGSFMSAIFLFCF